MIHRVCGHFGEWLQGRIGPDGPVALVTVQCPVLFVQAEKGTSGAFALHQSPHILRAETARAFLARTGGQLGIYRLTANMRPGAGAGASTAALMALAQAAGGQREDLTQACLAAEGASDPLMLPRPDGVLWASREARIVRHLAPLPRAEIVGGFWGPPEVTDPLDTNFPDISDLIGGLSRLGTLADLAALATLSARRCASLRDSAPDPTEKLARELGALGHLRAHTGSARGLIFPPGRVPAATENVLQRAGFTQVLRFRTGGRQP